MKPKTLITVFLSLFVAASLTYLVLGEVKGKPDAENDPAVPAAFTPSAVADSPSIAVPPEDTPAKSDPKDINGTPPDTYINVYYFHGNYRCVTCRTIEMYTREAVNGAFLQELGNGRLHMRILNMQEPENEGYVKDFGLEYYIVVVEKVVDGKRVEWKKLEKVWDLLNDKEAFKDYVVNETRDYLKGID